MEQLVTSLLDEGILGAIIVALTLAYRDKDKKLDELNKEIRDTASDQVRATMALEGAVRALEAQK